MKYLEAFLNEQQKISSHPRGDAPQKPQKQVFEVFKGPCPRGTEKILPAQRSVSSPSQPIEEGEPSVFYPELPAEHPTADWRCGYCGERTTIDEVCKTPDGQRWLTLWHCEPCQSYGCTPDAVKSPPIWVKRTEQ